MMNNSKIELQIEEYYETEKIIRDETISQVYFEVILEKFQNHEALFFIGCKFNEGISIGNIKKDSLRFKDCEGKDLEIYDFTNNLEFDNTPFAKINAVFKRPLNKLVIKNYPHGLYLRHPEYFKTNQPEIETDSEIKINTLYIRNVNAINLKNFTIQKLYIDTSSPDITSCNIESCRITKFIIRSGIQKLEFSNSILKNEFYILTHSIEEIKFNESNFKNSTFIFEGKPSELYKKFEYNNILWFKKILEKSHGKESIDLYRHFKGIGKNNNDDVMKFYFNAREYEAIRKYTKWNWPWNKEFWDKLMLSLNSFSNFHGIYWHKALVISVVFTVVAFVLYSFISGYANGYASIPFNKIFEFFIPTHKYDFLVKEPSFGATFIDFFHRIFNSYLIYQLIAAFRRYKG